MESGGRVTQRARPGSTHGRVAHMSIVHAPEDTRIYVRQCRSLAEAGYEVHLLAGGRSHEVRDGMDLRDLGRRWRRPRLRQQWLLQGRTLSQGWKLGAAVYHLHEPHLIPAGIAFKLRGARVVYDVHEHYPEHARTKLAGRPLRARLKGAVWATLEFAARRAFDGFVCASAEIATRFPPERTEVVHNYPPAWYRSQPTPYSERPPNVVYLGTLAPHRGLWEALEAGLRLPEELRCKLLFVGRVDPPGHLASAQRHPGWARVEHMSWLPPEEARNALARARVGLVAFHRVPNALYPDGNNKIYEYMAAGLPVVATNAPAWRRLVEDIGCGLVVDPLDPEAIAAAIEYLLANSSEAEEMGRRGQAAVAERFNWESEAHRLLSLYGTLDGA